jgi:tetratricopeptide (TPR) repeat protein
MELALPTPLRRGLFLAAALLLTGVLAYFTGRIWRAEIHAGRADLESWQRAAQIEPGNGDHWYRLGWFHQNDFASLDFDEAIANYQLALQRNPRSADYWMDLASAWEATGEIERAREAFGRAREAHPISGEIAWRLGNFHLRQEELATGFSEIRRALELDSKLTRLAVSLCWRAGGRVEDILENALPSSLEPRLLALEYFVSQREIEPALTTWETALRTGKTVELRRVVAFVDMLLGQRRLDTARTVWDQALVAAGFVAPASDPPPLVFDGGFATEPLNGGFGWRVLPAPGTRADFDEGDFRSEPRSLRLHFDGTTNVSFRNVWQLVPVEPNRPYRFSGYLRTESVSTDSGIRFWITDAINRGALDVQTHNVVGSQPWALEELVFTTSPETRLVRIDVLRIPSRKLDNKLSGQVWIDDIALELLPARGRPGAR